MRNVLCIGDVMLDKHRMGTVNRISPEAPVPVIEELGNQIISLGAAANVASHIVNMGGNCFLAYKKCKDTQEYSSYSYFEEICNKEGIHCFGLEMQHVTHPITTKERIWANKQQVCRIDKEDRTTPDNLIENIWIQKIIDIIQNNEIKVVVFSDYNKGTLTDNIIWQLSNYCHSKGIHTILDPKRSTFIKFSKITIIKPNKKEMEATGLGPIALSGLIGDTIIVNTLAENGVKVYKNGDIIYSYASLVSKNEVVDVCSAGDAFCACLAIGLANDWDIKKSIQIASSVCAEVIKHIGSYIPPKEVIENIISLYDKGDK